MCMCWCGSLLWILAYVNHAIFSPSHFLGGHYLFSFCFLFLLSYLVVPFPCSVFYQVQSLLGHLMDSKLQFYAPEHFWKCFKLWGQPVNVREQQVSGECAVMLNTFGIYQTSEYPCSGYPALCFAKQNGRPFQPSFD